MAVLYTSCLLVLTGIFIPCVTLQGISGHIAYDLCFRKVFSGPKIGLSGGRDNDPGWPVSVTT